VRITFAVAHEVAELLSHRSLHRSNWSSSHNWQLGRTLWRRRADILAFFDHHASNGPTEAINGRLEALRRNALGFRNLTNYRWRSLLHSGALHSLVNAL
jgi:transposase